MIKGGFASLEQETWIHGAATRWTPEQVDLPIDLSIVVPLHNEEDSVPILAEEIDQAMKRFPGSWECIWVDDGSVDSTQSKLVRIAQDHPGHRYLILDRNYGQSAALSLGFARAKGRLIATLDGDLQNDPDELPNLIEQLHTRNVHLVNGIRQKRNDNVIRKLSSRIGNGFRNLLTGKAATDVGCSLRVFHRECVQDLPAFKGLHRFLPTLIATHGFSIAEHPVSHRPRTLGRTKYGINNRLWVGILDTLFVRWYQIRHVRGRVLHSFPEEGEV